MRRVLLVVLAVGLVLGVGAGFFLLSRGSVTEIGPVARTFRREPRIRVLLAKENRVQEMPIEEYVAGVVAGEMREGWPVEAYAAQAILARSFTLDYISRRQSGREDVDISTDFEEAQAYNPAKITTAIRQAIERTRGQVVIHRGRYVRAFFHAYSGGHTATAKEGLNFSGPEPAYIQPVRMPPNPFVPQEYQRWRVEIPLEEVAEALRDRGVTGQVTDVRIAAKGPSGRATEFVVAHEGGETRIPGNDFRVALDPMHGLKSTLIRDLRVADGCLIVEGAGFGHGVGLSQWDALMFARRGRSPQDIVRTFFKDVEIRKLWN